MIYSQNDSRWKNVLLGFNTSTQYTIGTSGCYVTAIANICDWAGNSMTPQQINDICKQRGWFVNGGEISRDDIPALVCSNLAYAGRTNWSAAVNMNFFNDASDPNIAYIIEIDASPATGLQTHFTMVWSKLNANDLEINDSWDGIRKALSHYGDPSKILYSAIKYIKAVPVISAAPAVIIPFTTTPISPQIMAFNKPTHRWNLDLPTTDAMAAAPLETLPQGEQLTVVGIAAHQNGYQYYLQDINSHDGFNTLDCDPYVAPVVPVTPLPLPAAPVVAPRAETYTLVTVLPTYARDTDAISGVNSVGSIQPGTYYVWDKTGNIYQLGTDNQHAPTDNWIDTAKNVIAAPVVVPAPVKTTESSSDVIGSFKWFHTDRHPEEYMVLRDIVVYDMLHGGKPIRIDTNQTIEIYGYFKKDGHTYLRPLTGLDQQSLYYFYGILTSDSATFSGVPNLQAKLDWVEKTKVLFESLYEKAVKSIDGVFRRKK